jgi:GDPmannose 4,6-dehydratase
MRKKAIIFGINGQDGYYLTDFLLKKKYFIIGVARSKKINKYLKKFEKNILIKIKNKLDYNFLAKTIKNNKPNEIYFLIGQSSSSISFEQPLETIHSNFNLINYIVEICRLYSPNTKIFNASSSEIFGDSLTKVNENSKKDPQNPYALSKYLSLLCAKFYREKFKMFVCSGILFNHESEIRSKKNVIKKISEYLNKKIYYKKKLEIGNIKIQRDWGWAPEYIKAIWLILQMKKPDDYIVATGKSLSLEKVLNKSFRIKNLQYRKYIKINKKFFKKNEIKNISANTNKIFIKTGWKAKKKITDILKILIHSK